MKYTVRAALAVVLLIGVYERIGYEPVVDMVNLLVGGAVPDP